MGDVIVFDLATRNAIRGPSDTDPRAVIEPIPLTDGRFYVGVEVLDDPAHADEAVLLADIVPVDFETIRHLLPVPPPKGEPMSNLEERINYRVTSQDASSSIRRR